MSLLKFSCRHHYTSGFALNLNFETQHRITSLFGSSGSGKTSVLEMIAGLRNPQYGEISLDETILFSSEQNISRPLPQRRVGMVFQDLLLFPHYTVERNLRYGLARRHVSTAISFERVVQVLDLTPLLKRQPHRLSGGERQRVALGRALLSQPRLLLMDEPLTALDELLKSRIMAYLERVLEEWQLPTLLVSHAQLEVRRLADWVVVMENGEVLHQGTPEEALTQPHAMKQPGDIGPVNLLRMDEVLTRNGIILGRVSSQYLQLPAEVELAHSPVYVEFKPEAVVLSRQPIDALSVRNQLRGVIRRILCVDHIAFVCVDMGQLVWAKVTEQALNELALKEGESVTCLIKTQSLQVLE